MKQVGYDPDTEEFDADIIETGQSKSQRERRETVLALLEELDGATIAEISDRVEFDDKVLNYDIKKLKELGRIYSMNGNFSRT